MIEIRERRGSRFLGEDRVKEMRWSIESDGGIESSS